MFSAISVFFPPGFINSLDTLVSSFYNSTSKIKTKKLFSTHSSIILGVVMCAKYRHRDINRANSRTRNKIITFKTRILRAFQEFLEKINTTLMHLRGLYLDAWKKFLDETVKEFTSLTWIMNYLTRNIFIGIYQVALLLHGEFIR